MKRTLAQIAMESPLIVGIYESRLWRRSPLLTLLFGISFAREQATIFEAAALGGAERVLDLGCGTGIYTRPLARRIPDGRVVGLDLSVPMLRHARSRVAVEGLANVDLARGDAQRLPFAAARFDLVLCSGALHLFPDVARTLEEAHRVLRPAGRLIVAAFRLQSGRVADLTTRLRRGVGTHAFSRESLDARLAAAGFDTLRHHHAKAGWLIVSGRKTG
jgi:ubiquinone/menaquinone biosynthesis C-methylase UbiE